jgi:lipoprotein signal peptidase
MADSAITIGVILLFYQMMRQKTISIAL